MSYDRHALAEDLWQELEQGYNVVRIAKRALYIYSEYGLELTPELDQLILKLMAMEEGSEFELSEEQLRAIIRELEST